MSNTKPNSKYLKSSNTPIVILFIIWCFTLLFAFYYGTTSYESLRDLFSHFNRRDGLFLMLSPILCLVLSGVISADNKARLVFWRIHNPLPGCRAFSELAKRDARINMEKLKAELGKMPRKPEEQNSHWYSIYKKHDTAPIVQKAHQSFLLARDLAAISSLFAIIGSIILFAIAHDKSIVAFYFLTMLVHYVALALVARNHGERFVCNVLVECLIKT